MAQLDVPCSPRPPIIEPFKARLQEAASALEATLDSRPQDLGRVGQLLGDLSAIAEHIAPHEAQLLALSVTDATFALQSAATAEYRGAFASLRSSLELGIAGIYFSVREFELRLWLAGGSQFSWSAVMAATGAGPFSADFVRSYGDASLLGMAAEYRELASSSYSLCSDFIHGRRHVHGNMPDHVMFSMEILQAWSRSAEDALTALLFAAMIRFGEDLKTCESALDAFRDAFGHRQAVRDVIDGWVGRSSQ